jgi:hypothetical protein
LPPPRLLPFWQSSPSPGQLPPLHDLVPEAELEAPPPRPASRHSNSMSTWLENDPDIDSDMLVRLNRGRQSRDHLPAMISPDRQPRIPGTDARLRSVGPLLPWLDSCARFSRAHTVRESTHTLPNTCRRRTIRHTMVTIPPHFQKRQPLGRLVAHPSGAPAVNGRTPRNGVAAPTAR